MLCVFYVIDYAYTLICCFVYCHCRSLSYECICKHSMCTCATIVATCAQLIIRVLCELPTYTQCTLTTSLCHHSLKSPQLLRLSCAISGYSSVGRASDCRPLQQSNGPWFDSGWPDIRHARLKRRGLCNSHTHKHTQ